MEINLLFSISKKNIENEKNDKEQKILKMYKK